MMGRFSAMLHDERVYPEPARFNPDRFLEGEGRTPQQDPRDIAFGFGRRYVAVLSLVRSLTDCPTSCLSF